MTSPGRFDVTRVRLRNYRSISVCDVRLGPLTVLVGPNGSGKSNFLDSLRFVGQALDETLDNALRERGGVEAVRRKSKGHPTSFSMNLTFEGSDFAGTYSFKISAAKGGEYKVAEEECRVRRAEFGGEDHYFKIRGGEMESTSIQGVLPRTSVDRLFLVFASALDEFRAVYDGLTGINVYNLNPGVMREPQKPDAGELLRRDGSNVASVLEYIRRVAPDAKETVEEYLQLIVPGIVSADRKGFGNHEFIEFRQSVAGDDNPWDFGATSMSDGTVRALGILVAMFAPSGTGYSPIGIEEPETALHPAASGLLLEAITTASQTRQVLVTSHSPDMLDADQLGPESILAVRSDGGVTRIGPVDPTTVAALRDRSFTAGDLLRLDQLQPAGGSEQPELF